MGNQLYSPRNPRGKLIMRRGPLSRISPNTSPDRKKVHWTPNVQDNEGKTIRKPIARQSRPEDKTIVLSSKSHRRARTPLVPEPPRSRGPPPAPRPRRLPTPDLPDLKCEDFCDCCYPAPVSKMSAQRKIFRAVLVTSYSDPTKSQRLLLILRARGNRLGA